MEHQFSSYIEKIARLLVFVGIIFIPVSTTLNGLIVLAAALYLLSGQWIPYLNQFKSIKLFYPAFILLMFLLLGAFYNPHGLSEGLKAFYKYFTYFLVLFALMPLFRARQHREHALTLLVISTVFYTLLLNIELWSHLFSFSSLLAPIEFSILMAFVAFILLNRCFDESRSNTKKILYASGLGYLIFALYFVNIERTGMLLFFILLCLFGWQRLHWKGILISFSTILLFAGFLWNTSNAFHSRIIQAEQNIFHPSDESYSSFGFRAEYLKKSIELIKQHPISGLGTGLFTVGSVTILQHQDTLENAWSNYRLNVENTYLHIALQIGLLGLFVFVIWLATQLYETRYLPLSEKRLTQGLIILMIVTSFCILAFYVNRTAMLYATFLSILFAAQLERIKNLK